MKFAEYDIGLGGEIGYDQAISIEQEDILMSKEEGLQKAIEFLKPIILTQKRPKIWWA